MRGPTPGHMGDEPARASDIVDRLNAALEGRYRIEREVGSGGMATVYLAEDLRHHRRVALKVLRQELAATMGPERFFQEVRVTANLQHPHILPLFDSGEADGFLFYVMPFADGESLRERLDREGELPVAEAARILRDVVDALGAAHALGIVHRDVKPENIMLSGRHALVTDFGVAKAVSEATGRYRLTTTGVALGTPSYMAPEQAAADTHIDHRADVYAVGTVAYEILTGAPPFSGRSPQALLAAQVTERPPPVTERRPAVPPALESLVMRCLEKKPADRWQHAEEMLPVLESLAAPTGGMTPVGTGSTPPKRKAPIRALATVLVAGTLAVGGWWGSSVLRRRAASSPTTAAHAVDPGLFAIFPFRVNVTDSSLVYLREGMVDLLHVKLAAMRRSVEPRTVLDAWRRAGGGEEDPPLDAEVRAAAALSAGRVLLGSVVGSPDRLTLSATLYEAPGDQPLATASVDGAVGDLQQLGDQLIAELLSLEAGESRDRLTSLTTTSTPALLAYLQGMSLYRRGLYDEATESLVRAVDADSTFALAGLYLSEAWGMGNSSMTPHVGERAERVVRANRDRLGSRDRVYSEVLYPEGDTSAIIPDGGDPRIVARWQAAIDRLRDRPEAWYHLGDRLFHNGAVEGIPDFLPRAREAFEQAVALDSTYFTPKNHLWFIYANEGDTAALRRAATSYLQVEHTGSAAEGLSINLTLLSRDTAALPQLLDTLDSYSQVSLADLTIWVPVQLPWVTNRRLGEKAADILLQRALTPEDREEALSRAIPVALSAGHPGKADSLLAQWGALSAQDSEAAERQRILAAVFWDGDRAAADSAARRIGGTNAPEDAYARAMFRLWRGSTGGVRQTIARLMQSDASRADTLRAMILETRLADVGKDRNLDSLTEALDHELLRGPWSVVSQGNLTVAGIFQEQGDFSRALAASTRILWFTGGDAYASSFLLHEARAAAALGQTDEAAQAYRRYLDLREEPEPGLQPLVDSVRAEFDALDTGGS